MCFLFGFLFSSLHFFFGFFVIMCYILFILHLYVLYLKSFNQQVLVVSKSYIDLAYMYVYIYLYDR